jgi:hypothetical protein
LHAWKEKLTMRGLPPTAGVSAGGWSVLEVLPEVPAKMVTLPTVGLPPPA